MPVHSQDDKERDARVQRMKHSGKIFCIGMTKTGTSSLDAALRRMGYASNHSATGIHQAIMQALEEGKEPLAYLMEYDGITSSNWVWQNYKTLDALYPGSKFVLTTRKEPGWIASLERHAVLNRYKPTYKGKFTKINPAQQLARWREHHADVADYFRDRPDDMLSLAVVEGEGYEKLCPFLGHEVIDEPFPSANSSKPRLAKVEQKNKVKYQYQNFDCSSV